MDYVSFGKILLDRRKEIGLTREKAGELIGVSGATIQNWEAGKNLPDYFNLASVTDVYQFDQVEFLEMIRNIICPQREKVLPVELFDDKELEKIKSLVFSREEHDFFSNMVLFGDISSFPAAYFRGISPGKLLYIKTRIEKIEEKYQKIIKRCLSEKYYQEPFSIFHCSDREIGWFLVEAGNEKYKMLRKLRKLIVKENGIPTLVTDNGMETNKPIRLSEEELEFLNVDSNELSFLEGFPFVSDTGNRYELTYPEYTLISRGYIKASPEGVSFYNKYKKYIKEENI